MATLEGGCAAPIGALAEVAEGDDGPELWLRAVVLSEDGALAVRRSASAALGPEPASWPADAAKLGGDLGAEMLADGADELMARPNRSPDPNSHPSARSAEVPNP